MNIASETLQDQDVIRKNACSNCFHSIKEHEKDKCYALDFDGTTYSACRCTKLTFEYKIRLKVPILNGDKV